MMTKLGRTLLLFGLVGVAAPAVAPAQVEATRDGPLGFAHSITVPGHGIVSVPPDAVRVVLRFFPRQVAGGISYDDAARAMVDAMKKAGVPEARLALPLENVSGPNVQPAIVATVRKPTRDLLERLARDTIADLPSAVAPAFTNYQLTTALLLDDCSAPETRAQDAAIADARTRAERVAAAAGVKLGGVLSVNEGFAFASTACREGSFNQAGPGFSDPYGPLEVPIAVNLTVTYAII